MSLKYRRLGPRAIVRLYFVRHGETDHNVARRIQGPLLDDPLNARGREQAAALEARFARARDADGLRIASVYASPMKRAWETAEALARGVGAPPPVATPALIEFSWGKHLGQTESGETLAAMKRYHHAWDSGDVTLAVEGGGESPASAFERAWKGVGPIVAKHAARDETIALVAHGRIFKIVLSKLVAGDLAKMDAFPQGNTGVTILEHDARGSLDAGWHALTLNDRSHLGPRPPQIPGDALV